MPTEEEKRLGSARDQNAAWRNWGPYLSERQWGTVREDYSENEDAWNYLTHDQARSRAYRWGEDGIAGISDNKQRLCFAIALWNGKDPILKERLFGLSGSEGNHGEDVKEYYFYLDNLPSHAYMKYLYKYPQEAFPYEDLVRENGRRSRRDFEYELLDTGIFNEDKYFDVFVEYAKADVEDMLIRISIVNRGKASAPLHLLPSLWFRNTWSWVNGSPKPELKMLEERAQADHPNLGSHFLYADKPKEWLFTENETNKKRLFGVENDSPYVKDAFHEYVVKKNQAAVNPQKTGTKAAAHFVLNVEAGATEIVRLRLSKDGSLKDPFGKNFEGTFSARIQEAEDFYKSVTPFVLPEDMKNVQRQAFAGMLWNKQYYEYDVRRWLDGDPTQPPSPADRKRGRNSRWKMLRAENVFSMPDNWEYPWFAAWDLAFHTVTFAVIDPDFAKHQLLLLTKEWYMHPDGQIPAYEWDFGDVNPPVHAWAAFRVYQIEEKRTGRKDRAFLEEIFQKLCLNFTWWVNRKDAGGRNIFEGGFLGLDNIGAFDRTKGIPEGGMLLQPDGTGWMGMYCLNLLQIALELAIEDPIYDSMAAKFLEHFIFIADAMNSIGEEKEGLWDEKDGYYYGRLILPDGRRIKTTQVSFVGAIPLFAVATSLPSAQHPFPEYRKRFQWFIDNRPELVENIVEDVGKGASERILLCLADSKQMSRILEKILNEEELLSSFGIRSVSKSLSKNPYVLDLDGKEYRLDYEPAESTIPLFGGNSNWRGPIWFPLNFLMIESIQKYHFFLGDDFKVACPTGSSHMLSLWDVSQEISHRLMKIFLKDEKGRRPLYGGIEKFQTDPHWKDYILFHEYFHGDNGAGLGASAQTGWTGLVAKLIQQYGEYVLGHKSPTQIEKKHLGVL
jgi:hypothetical protein